jgi:dinuclear metal center YbgI/SA1388 family protein
MAIRDEIIAYCDVRLRATAFHDTAINGLQVAGYREIDKLAVAVSASRYTIEEAAAWGADALLVHHGLLWGDRLRPLTGILGGRLRALFRDNINLIAYHLPLDAHPEIGNCALLAAACGYEMVDHFAMIGGEPIGVVGEQQPGSTLEQLVATLTDITGRTPLVVGVPEEDSRLTRIGFVTGSGYSALEEAVAAGCGALITGDVRESTMAEARELGILVIAAGHEATERAGVQALADELAERYELDTRFIADPNPV